MFQYVVLYKHFYFPSHYFLLLLLFILFAECKYLYMKLIHIYMYYNKIIISISTVNFQNSPFTRKQQVMK